MKVFATGRAGKAWDPARLTADAVRYSDRYHTYPLSFSRSGDTDVADMARRQDLPYRGAACNNALRSEPGAGNHRTDFRTSEMLGLHGD